MNQPKDLESYLASGKAEAEAKGEAKPELEAEAGKTADSGKETPKESPAENKPATNEPSQGGGDSIPDEKTEKLFHKRWESQRKKLIEDSERKTEEKLAAMRQEFESKLPKQPEATPQMPKWFELAFGNNPELYKEYLADQAQNRAAIKEEALREYRESAAAEKAEVEKWSKEIDKRLSDLSDTKGIEMTKSLRNEILAVVSEYSPKDANGNFLGDFIPFEKAYEIIELRRKATPAPVDANARKQVAANTAPTKSAAESGGFKAQKIGDYMKADISQFMSQQ